MVSGKHEGNLPRPAPEPARPEIGIIFGVLTCAMVAAVSYLPPRVHEFWRQLVMKMAVITGQVLGVDVVAAGHLLFVNGFAMTIADECTATGYLAIIIMAMLLYVKHGLRYRLAGIAFAVPMIISANALRLVITGMCGKQSWALFHFVHDYLWVVLFALLVFVLWKFWIDGSLGVGCEAAKRIAVITACSSAIFALLSAFLREYLELLCFLGSLPLKLILQNSTVNITWSESGLQCVYAGKKYGFGVLVEYLNVSVLLGLILPLQQLRSNKVLLISLLSVASAVLLNAVFIANTFLLAIWHSDTSLSIFLLIEKCSLLAVPFVLWWVVLSAKDGISPAQ